MQDHNQSRLKATVFIGIFMMIPGLMTCYGQNIVGLNTLGGETYSAEANNWYKKSGIGYRTIVADFNGFSQWRDVYKRAEFNISHVSTDVLLNTVSMPRLIPCTAKAWSSPVYGIQCQQFQRKGDGTWALTDPSLTFSKYLDLWLENYAKPAIEFYADKGCYILDFGSESWPAHYWGNGGPDAWYPVDKLCVAPEIPVVAGETNLNALLTSQYAKLNSPWNFILEDFVYRTICGLRPPTPPADGEIQIVGADTNILIQIFDIAGQLRIKDDYIAQKIRNTYQRLYEWKAQHYPKVVIAFSTHGGLLGTLKNHADEVVYVDWFGPDFTPTTCTLTGFRNGVYNVLSSVIQDNSNKVWGMGFFESIMRISTNELGLAGTPYAAYSLCQSDKMTQNHYRWVGPTFQELCDYFYDIDHANNYIKCLLVNRVFQAARYSDIYAAAHPPLTGGDAQGWGAVTQLAPWTFVDSDEPLGTTINPCLGIADPNLALWDGDGDGDLWDLDDPLLEIRGFGNRWGRGCPPLDVSGNPISDIYGSKYSYLVHKMYNPADPVYSYWRIPYPIIPVCSYDYQTQRLTVSLQNAVGPDPMSTDCLIFQRQSFSPPWGSVVKARPQDLEAALPAPEYFVSAGSYSIPGKIFNSAQRPASVFSLAYPIAQGRFCYVFLKDKPGVKGLAVANEITQFSSLELNQNEHLKGYLDVRDIIPENTEDTIAVRIVVKDVKGFETASVVMQKHVSLIYGGMDFIPVSYALNDSDGGIVEEKIEIKRSGDSAWTAIDRRELIIPVYFPEVAKNKIMVDPAHPFVTSSGYAQGCWDYGPNGGADCLLERNTKYRLHIIAHSPDGCTLGAYAYGCDTNWNIVETQSTGLWNMPLGPEPQEFVGGEFMLSSPLTTRVALLYLYRSNQQGTLIVDKAWLEITGDNVKNKIMVDPAHPFVASSGYAQGCWDYNPGADCLLALNTTYRLHIIAHSPDGCTLGAYAYGYNSSWSIVETQSAGLWNMPLGPEPQKFVGGEFMLSSPLTTHIALLYLYRSNQQGTLIVDAAWLEVADTQHFKDNSNYVVPMYGELDPMLAYRLHVIARSPDSAAALGAYTVGYDGFGCDWYSNMIEGHYTGLWNVKLGPAPQEYIGDVFYMQDIGTRSALLYIYRSNQTGTLIIERAWLTVEGLRPELFKLISPDYGLDSGYCLEPTTAFDPLKVYQLSVVAQSPNGAQVGATAVGFDLPNPTLFMTPPPGRPVEEKKIIWNVPLGSDTTIIISSPFYLENILSVGGIIRFYRSNQSGQLNIKRAWLTPLGSRP